MSIVNPHVKAQELRNAESHPRVQGDVGVGGDVAGPGKIAICGGTDAEMLASLHLNKYVSRSYIF